LLQGGYHWREHISKIKIHPRRVPLNMIFGTQVQSGKMRQYVTAPVTKPRGLGVLHQRTEHHRDNGPADIDKCLSRNPAHLKSAIAKCINQPGYRPPIAQVTKTHHGLEPNAAALGFQRLKQRSYGWAAQGHKRPPRALPGDGIPLAKLLY